jgi:hypothetical protein
MNEAVENVCVEENVSDVGPEPPSVPGDFTIRLGDMMAGQVLEELEEKFGKFGGVAGAASGFLSVMHWVEEEVRRYPDPLEGLGRLKGALMVVGTAIEGEARGGH